ncbi:MAG: Hsp20/alpha crystallin family protein [Thermomicrobiaceae bacterium]
MVERWVPFRDVDRMFDEMDRFVTDRMGRNRTVKRNRGYRPAMDVYDSGEHLVIKALIPGAHPEDLDISIEQNMLTIKGSLGYKVDEEQSRQVTWYQREIGYSDWAESLQLPTPVDSENAEAEFEHGILTLTLPKAEQARVKRIPVQSNRQLQSQT